MLISEKDADLNCLAMIAQRRFLPSPTKFQLLNSERAVRKIWCRFQVCLRIFRLKYSFHDPDEYLEVAMLGLNEAIKTYRSERGNFEPWMLLKINTYFQQRLRFECGAKSKFLNNVLQLDSLPEDIAITPYQDEQLDNIFLREILESLSDRDQTLFRLYLEGYSWVSIGEKLGWNDDRVRITFNRSLNKLRKRLQLSEEIRPISAA
jgi:RNA polymerase sigma factor (sigma-70 family)